MSNEVKVSVLCITYNQKDYISDGRSFLPAAAHIHIVLRR